MGKIAVKPKELSWSLSKARMFEECPRRYYYHYYFAKIGYAPDAPEEARLALEMRHIKGLDMWVGEVVHATIQWVLEQAQGGVMPSAQDAKAEARRRLSAGWQGSVKQLWRTDKDEIYPNLFEHYYDIAVTPAITDRLKDKAFVSVGNFMDSEVLRRIAATPPSNWLPIEKYASFRLDGLLCYVKFDFALRDDERLTVFDWKTGNPSVDETRQLACYAMYTSSRWQVPIEAVRVCPVHLQPILDVDERFVAEEDIEELRTFAKSSFSGMVKCLRNPARDLAAMDDFPMTGNLLRCVRCNFRGVCVQGKQALGDPDDLPVVEDWDG